jgi:hypothetical protein
MLFVCEKLRIGRRYQREFTALPEGKQESHKKSKKFTFLKLGKHDPTNPLLAMKRSDAPITSSAVSGAPKRLSVENSADDPPTRQKFFHDHPRNCPLMQCFVQ